MGNVWVEGWRAFRLALPHVFRAPRRRIFFAVTASGLLAGAVLSAVLYWALGPGHDDDFLFLALLICVGATIVAAAICAQVFSHRDRTSKWWIAGTHVSTMKRVLEAARAGALDTVSAQDLHDARRAAEILTQSTPAAIVGPLIFGSGALLLLVIGALAGGQWSTLFGLCLCVAQTADGFSRLLILGRAQLVTRATDEHPSAAQ